MRTSWIGLLLTGGLLFAGSANASFVFDIAQVGNNVVATGSGSINLTGLNFYAYFAGPPGINSGDGYIRSGPTLTLADEGDIYTGVTGPASFGTGSLVFGSTGTGDPVGIEGSSGWLYLPGGYISGTPLADSITFNNETLAKLGLTTGTSYTWNWGSGANADSLTVDIGVQPVPEPKFTVPVVLALGMLPLLVRRRRQRARLAASFLKDGQPVPLHE